MGLAQSLFSNGNGTVVQEERESTNALGLHLPNDDNNNIGGVFIQQEEESSNNNIGGVFIQQEEESSNVNGFHVPENGNNKKEFCGVLPPMVGTNPSKKTLVLDLDETLVHATRTPTMAGYHYSITFKGRDRPSYYVLKRPGVDELLRHLGATGLYEIVLFTAASKKYANAVVDSLLDSLPDTDSIDSDTKLNIIPSTHRLSNEHCCKVGDVVDVKDLTLLGRDLRNIIFVDDRCSSYHLQPQNAIPVNAWEGKDFEDKTLFNILSFCLEIANSTTDVRKLISTYLRSVAAN